MEIVKVSGGLPNKLPWVEGVDYTVLDGEPEVGDTVRMRGASGEEFLTKRPPAPAPSPAPAPATPTLAEIKAKLDEIAALVSAL